MISLDTKTKFFQVRPFTTFNAEALNLNSYNIFSPLTSITTESSIMNLNYKPFCSDIFRAKTRCSPRFMTSMRLKRPQYKYKLINQNNYRKNNFVNPLLSHQNSKPRDQSIMREKNCVNRSLSCSKIKLMTKAKSQSLNDDLIFLTQIPQTKMNSNNKEKMKATICSHHIKIKLDDHFSIDRNFAGINYCMHKKLKEKELQNKKWNSKIKWIGASKDKQEYENWIKERERKSKLSFCLNNIYKKFSSMPSCNPGKPHLVILNQRGKKN